MIIKQTLSRYSRNADNQIMIEIAAGKVEDIYNNFDSYTPYARKDLDPQLVEYLIDSISDIGKEDFVIQFRFTSRTNEVMMDRVKASIQNYFLYLVEREHRVLDKMMRASFIFFLIGISILSVSIWIEQNITNESFIVHILTQGLTVAAWVSLWNAIATFLINWSPHRQKIKLYQRIARAPIFFGTLSTRASAEISAERNQAKTIAASGAIKAETL